MKRVTSLTTVVALLAMVAVSGCGGGASEDTGTVVKPAQSSGGGNGGTSPQATGGGTGESQQAKSGFGTFRGRVVVSDVPASYPLSPLVNKGDSSVRDPAVCAAQDIPNQKVVINDGGLANVFIYLRRAPRNGKEQAAHEPTGDQIFDQKNCTFIPHAMVARVGEAILVKNSDPVNHNVKSQPAQNDPFTATLDKGAEPVELVYTQSELQPFKIECNFHNWMSAYHLPVDHPYAVVTKADGTFEINGLPVGTHRFNIWHETAGQIDTGYEVEITADGEVVEKDISVSGSELTAFTGPKSKTLKLSLNR